MLTNIVKTIAATLGSPKTAEEERRAAILEEWDRQLEQAINARDRAEIDAIFSRAL
jgi:hypothetical protein